MSKYNMVERIKRAGIFEGIKELSNKDVLEGIAKVKRKRTHNGDRLDQWMKDLEFRKEYRRYHENGESYSVTEKGCANYRLWWVR